MEHFLGKLKNAMYGAWDIFVKNEKITMGKYM